MHELKLDQRICVTQICNSPLLYRLVVHTLCYVDTLGTACPAFVHNMH